MPKSNLYHFIWYIKVDAKFLNWIILSLVRLLRDLNHSLLASLKKKQKKLIFLLLKFKMHPQGFSYSTNAPWSKNDWETHWAPSCFVKDLLCVPILCLIEISRCFPQCLSRPFITFIIYVGADNRQRIKLNRIYYK